MTIDAVLNLDSDKQWIKFAFLKNFVFTKTIKSTFLESFAAKMRK